MVSIQTIIVLIFGLIIVGGAYCFYLRDKNQQAVKEKPIFAIFLSEVQGARAELCYVDGEIVIPPQGIKRPTEGDKEYLIKGDRTWDFVYPLGQPRWFQVSVPLVIYHEGNIEPVSLPDQSSIYSPEMFQALRNQRTATWIVSMAQESLAKLDDLVRTIKEVSNFKGVMLMIGVVLVAVGIGVYVNLRVEAALKSLMALYGLQ